MLKLLIWYNIAVAVVNHYICKHLCFARIEELTTIVNTLTAEVEDGKNEYGELAVISTGHES